MEAQRAALARLGLITSLIATAEWANVSPLKPAANAAIWATKVLRAIYALRLRAKRAAVAGYQLARALDTGYTLGTPLGHPEARRQATLDELRQNFEQELVEIATIDTEPGGIDDPDIRWVEQQLQLVKKDRPELNQVFQDTNLDPYIQNLLDKQGSDGGARITVEPYDWGKDMTLEQVDKAFRNAIEQQAVKSQEDFIAKARKQEDKTPDQVISEIEKHHDTAGGTGAGMADKAVMDSARNVINLAARRDRRVKKVARGTGPNPCAFCAMLASRGFVYSSEQAAAFEAHIHCHCYPIVRWVSNAQLPPLSQFFKDQWHDVTAGYGTTDGHPDALNAWRRWLYRQRKEGFQFPANINLPNAA
jgi:hypothetical protein